MPATNQITTMSAAAAIAPIVLKSDQCEGLGTVYLAEKNTFLEFFNEESMSVKQQAFGRRSASKDSYLKKCCANMVCSPDMPACLPRNQSMSTMIPSEEIMTPDSTPRWCNIHQYPGAGCSDQKGNTPNVELQSPDLTPRNSYTYQSSYSEWNDNQVSIPQLKLPISPRNETNAELQSPVSTPRWNNTYNYGDFSCEDQKAEAHRESWADQSEVLTPDTTPRWSNAYGYEATPQPQPQPQRSMSVCSESTPRCNPMAFMTVPAPIPASQAADVEKLQPPMPPAQASELEALRQRLAALESENQRLKSDEKIHLKPQSCYNEVPATPAEEKTLTISLDMLLVGGLKQSAGRPTNCAPSSEHKESTMQPTRVNTVNTCSKKQMKKHQKAGPVTAEGATTLMMRGIPCGLTTENLIDIVDNAGFKGRYNFFYLPSDAKKKANLGYCFINFIDAHSAEQCTAAFKGVRLAPLRSAKSCSVAPASIQGLARLSEHFKYTTMSRGASGPLFFNC